MLGKRPLQKAIRAVHLMAARRVLPERVAVCFHSLEKGDLKNFQEFVEHLRDDGYAFSSAGDLLKDTHEKAAFLSFDDNYRSWYSSLTLLDDLELTVTFFINTLPIRGRASTREVEDYYDRIEHEGERVALSDIEIRELHEAGHSIGCHGHSHRALSSLPERVLATEIADSKKILEDIIGKAVVDFAYPYGMRRHFSEKIRDLCVGSGFTTISNGTSGLQYREQRPESINRTVVSLGKPWKYNFDSLRIDGRLFSGITGRSAVP